MYQEAQTKIAKFCAAKERCTSEVIKKLAGFSLSEYEQEALLQFLREGRYLDDRRFVSQFIKSKVELYKWGRVKIFQALETKELPLSLIEEVWDAELNREIYLENFKTFFEKKWASLEDETDLYKKKAKLYQHLSGKGFEPEFIERVLEDL